jgi:capsular polysaccharide biosynthesis protein
MYIPTNKPFASKIAAFRAGLDRIEDVAPHPDAKKRIYVSRKSAATRQLVNEEELLSMLESEFEFHPILNEDYTIIDQVAIYRDADIVIGPHGAGLTNTLFAESPSLLAEMFSQVQQPFYQTLAQAMGIRYLGVPGTPARPDNDPTRADNAPFRVDVSGVREALGKMLG